MADLLQISLDIFVSKKIDIAEEDTVNETNPGYAEQPASVDAKEDYFVFRLRETKKGTDAHMFYYPKEQMYVIKANSKVSANETKDCSPDAMELRKNRIQLSWLR